MNKASVNRPKMMLGPCRGGAVRLASLDPNDWLVIGEGIETTLSVMQACGIPGWAALSAGGIQNLVLPPEANMVLICADNDANGVGRRAAESAAERFVREGRRVRITMPPNEGQDFNDVRVPPIKGKFHDA
jgi:putative DNA primase/helicase